MTRRLRPGCTAAVVDACHGRGALASIGMSLDPKLQSELERCGIELVQGSGHETAESPDVVAARFATTSTPLELVPASAREAAVRRARRLAHALFAAAAALVVAAAGLEWWGTARELDRVAGARVQHRKQVAEALAVRAALDRWDGRLGALRTAEMGAVRWSGVLAGLAEHLPADAYVTALRATPDSVILEGEARQAAASFESLRKAPVIAGLRAMAPIRQEAHDSGPPTERFVLGASLRPDLAGVGSER